MRRIRIFVAVGLVLACGFPTGCASHRGNDTRKWAATTELRPRLAQLRKGMGYQEVAKILKIDLASDALSTNWHTYHYPGPIYLRGSPPPWEEAGYELQVVFASVVHGEKFDNATLTTRNERTESWPK